MEYPTIFISNSHLKVQLSDSFGMFQFKDITIAYNKGIKSKLFVADKPNFFILAHVNFACRNKLEELINAAEKFIPDYTSIKSVFRWGFLLYMNKETGQTALFNDIYGIYPVYFTQIANKFIISNDFDALAQMQDSLNINIHGIYDYFMFNYTLKSRTLFKEISQLQGGSKVEFNSTRIKIYKCRLISEVVFEEKANGTIEDMKQALYNNIMSDIDPELPVQFALTGGFDSKVVLAALLSNNINFSSYTYGYKQSDDNTAAESIAEKFRFKHELLELSTDFIQKIELHIKQFMRCSPNAPMFETLLFYELVKESIPSSNICTGMMGGELIVGPVLISELLTTRSAALLTLSSNKKDLFGGLKKNMNETGIFNNEIFEGQLTEYAEPLLDYMKNKEEVKNQNMVNFLLNETYAKFFGVIFNNLFNNINLVNPFVGIDFLKILLNSKYSFTQKYPFSKAPFSHFMSRRLYPKLIESMYPTVLHTKMDRGYQLEDFLKWYKFHKPVTNYFRRHFFSKKNPPPPSSNYTEALLSLVKETIGTSEMIDWEIFDKSSILMLIKKLKNKNVSRFQTQKLIQLVTIYFFIKRYSSKLSVSK